MNYKVNEIFDSIQGEGSWMGISCTFIRLAGCNLMCPWCDTDKSKNYSLTELEIMKHVHKRHVVITGGEPLIQDLRPLLRELGCAQRVIAIETNGSFNAPKGIDHIVVSPKSDNGYSIAPQLRVDELKYVVDSIFDDAIAIPESIREGYKNRIWLQPESSDMVKNWARCYELAMEDQRLRVGIQMHKIIGVK